MINIYHKVIMDSQLITQCIDTENYLLLFLDYESIINYSQLSKTNNKIIQRHNLFSPLLDYHKSYQNMQFVDWICKVGNLNILQWHKNSVAKMNYTDDAIRFATEEGHINILEWWVKSGLVIKFKNEILGRITNKKSLDWWLDSDLRVNHIDSPVVTAKEYIEIIEFVYEISDEIYPNNHT